jgi:ribosome modulation factor
MTTTRRRAEIARLQEEGYQARMKGKPRQQWPPEYNHTMNVQHWLAGWDAADHNITNARFGETTPAVDNLNDLVLHLLNDLDALGFGTDQAISGADTIDVVNKYLTLLKVYSTYEDC